MMEYCKIAKFNKKIPKSLVSKVILSGRENVVRPNKRKRSVVNGSTALTEMGCYEMMRENSI
jgi:hypothetical protein